MVCHRNIFGSPQATYVTCRFTVLGSPPTVEQRTRLGLQFRDPQHGGQPTPDPPLNVHTNGDVRSTDGFGTDGIFVDLVSQGFAVLTIIESGSWSVGDPGASFDQIIETLKDEIADVVADVNSGFTQEEANNLLNTLRDSIPAWIALVVGSAGTAIPGVIAALTAIVGAAFAALGVVVAAAASRQFGRRLLVDLVPLPVPQPTITITDVVTYSLKRMCLIGQFVLDDESGALRALNCLQPEDPDPPHLDPLPDARIENMMFVEQTAEKTSIDQVLGIGSGAPAADHALAVGIDARNAPIQLLQTTPGIFRVLSPAQDPQFDFNHPFIFQDGRRVYLVTLGDQFDFTIHFHPRIGELIKTLKREGVPGLLRLPAVRPTDNGTTFMATYHPTPIYVPYLSPASVPNEDIDFTLRRAPTPLYNWELFFHIPFLIATRLSQQPALRRGAALVPLHLRPDGHRLAREPRTPRARAVLAGAAVPRRRQQLGRRRCDSAAANDAGRASTDQVDRLAAPNPFKPHVIARLRAVAYKKAVVMKYLDNLIAWGDQLFRQDTHRERSTRRPSSTCWPREILGRRPEAASRPRRHARGADVPHAGRPRRATASRERGRRDREPRPGRPRHRPDRRHDAAGALPTAVLLHPAERQAARLLGHRRRPAVQDPPLHEHRGRRAAAAAVRAADRSRRCSCGPPPPGVDIASVLADLERAAAALPLQRHAAEGRRALRRRQARSARRCWRRSRSRTPRRSRCCARGHEVALLKAMRDRQAAAGRRGDARRSTGCSRTRTWSPARQRLLPRRPFMNRRGADRSWLCTTASLSRSGMQAGCGGPGGDRAPHPGREARVLPRPPATTYGGDNIGSAHPGRRAAPRRADRGDPQHRSARLSATLGGYQRRQDDWTLQADLAAKELAQIDEADRRRARSAWRSPSRSWRTTTCRSTTPRRSTTSCASKYTNQELYDWMVGQISRPLLPELPAGLRRREARRARLSGSSSALADSSFIQFGYWDSLKKGLLAGERLHHDLQRMDVAYLDQNRREYEITKHVSLRRSTRRRCSRSSETGECFVDAARGAVRPRLPRPLPAPDQDRSA